MWLSFSKLKAEDVEQAQWTQKHSLLACVVLLTAEVDTFSSSSSPSSLLPEERWCGDRTAAEDLRATLTCKNMQEQIKPSVFGEGSITRQLTLQKVSTGIQKQAGTLSVDVYRHKRTDFFGRIVKT